MTGITHMPVSTGFLYFFKYIFLALALYFVYYIARIIGASLKGTLGESRRDWQQRHGEKAQGKSHLSAGSASGVAEVDSLATECTVASIKVERSWGERLRGIKNSRSKEANHFEGAEEVTCGSLKAIASAGFLEIVSGVDTKTKRLPIEKEPITLGRARDCTIRVRDGFASSHHAKVYAGKDGAILEDTDSRNGTFLGEERLQEPLLLEDGDVFSIGDATFRYTRF